MDWDEVYLVPNFKKLDIAHSELNHLMLIFVLSINSIFNNVLIWYQNKFMNYSSLICSVISFHNCA